MLKIREPELTQLVDNKIAIYRCFGMTQFTLKNTVKNSQIVVRGGTDYGATSPYFFDRSVRLDQIPDFNGNVAAIVISSFEAVNPTIGLDVTHSSNVYVHKDLLWIQTSGQRYTIIDYHFEWNGPGGASGRRQFVLPPDTVHVLGDPETVKIDSIYLDPDWCDKADHPLRRGWNHIDPTMDKPRH